MDSLIDDLLAFVDVHVGIRGQTGSNQQSLPSITLSIARCCSKIVLPEPRRLSGKTPQGNLKT